MTMTERKDALPCRMQDLPPAGARLCMAVGRFLKEKCGVSPHHVIVAFSGGADSTALAVILRCLGVSLVLAHLDHRLRPESGEEAESARRFAERLGVPCMVRRVDVEALARSEGIGLEDAGRRARYAFFDSALLSERAEWVVTGHHLDDLSEDVLMRLVRGSGWPGLGGMKAVDPARRLLRPLLGTPRAELEAFLRSLGVDWIEDASNRSDAFRRNRMRNHVIPLLKAENPSFPAPRARFGSLPVRTNTIGTRCLPRCSRSSGRKTAASCCRVLPLSRCRVRRACAYMPVCSTASGADRRSPKRCSAWMEPPSPPAAGRFFNSPAAYA